MRFALLVALSLPAQDGNDAKQLFQKMEATLDKAGAIDLSFRITYGEAALRSGQRLKGTLVDMSGNKLRLHVIAEKTNETVHLRVADGRRAIVIVEGDKGKANKLEIKPKNLTANLLTVVARSGVLPALLPLAIQGEENDYKALFTVSGFEYGGKEKVGERVTRRIHYVLGVKGQKTTYPVTLWIELKTGLPVKRLVADGDLPWFTETYELRLNGKVDPKNFELPR